MFQRDGVRRLVTATAAIGGLAALVLVSSNVMAGRGDQLRNGRRIVELTGPQGFARVNFTPPVGASGVTLDATRAVFTVANSHNPNPTAAQNCDTGTDPINRYPLLIQNQDRTEVLGGLFLSRVPQASEWRATYCNSAAITYNAAPDGVVDGVRITGAWDAIRAGRDSPNLTIANSWISNARDDAVENDFLQTVTIRDTLIDGAFQGISVKPRKAAVAPDASSAQVTLSGLLLRLQEYAYKDERRFGALLKSDQRAPRAHVVNSVIAIDYAGGNSYPQYWATTWSKVTQSSNNLFLWLSDAPIPAYLPLPPSGFRVLRGSAARDAWARAKINWINCHPKVTRLPSDPRSNARACVRGTWGGFTD